jgi:O-antigen ligase
VPAAACGVAVLAAWGAARHPAAVPLIWLALTLACLAVPVGERRFLDPGWLLVAVLVLAVGWTVALDHELALRHSLLFVAAALTFGLARRAPPGDRLLGALAALLAATAVVAVIQVAGGLDAARGLVDELPAAMRERAALRLASGRAFGTASLPGHFAALLLLAGPLLVDRVWRARGWRRVGWGLAVAAVGVGLVLTRSLAGWAVAAALVLAALAHGVPARLRWLAAAAVVLVGVATFALRHDLARLEPVVLRWVNWQTAGWVAAHHPWLGVGLGGIGQAALLAPTAAANSTPYAHNSLLQLGAELGVAGLLPVAVGLGALLVLLRAGWKEDRALALSVAVLPLHNLLDFSLYAPEVALPWAVLAGALAGRLAGPVRRATPALLLLPALLGGLVLSTLAWRAEAEGGQARLLPRSDRVDAAVAAAGWAPWTVTPLLVAAGEALDQVPSSEDLVALDAALAARWWVQPRSASWAEARARLLLAADRPGEALVWAREARRRAPFRDELESLEGSCAAPH